MSTRNLWGAAAAWTGAILLLAGSAARAGWTQLTSGTASALLAVDFPLDTMTGYVVGATGDILKTTNGGATWTNVQDPAYTDTMQGVHFPVDASTGYVVGTNGRILKTTDGGANWAALTPPADDFTGLSFLDNQTGYVVGSSSILKTTDGGNNWTDVTDYNYGATYYDVCFPLDASTGYLGAYALLLKTADGGATWTDVTPDANYLYYGVDFPLSSASGIAAGPLTAGGAADLSRTTDGGSSWTPMSPAPPYYTVYDVDFADASIGYAVGTSAQILKTADGGATWEHQYPTVNSALLAVCAPDAMTAYAVGSSGVILKTSDGGLSHLAIHPQADGSENSFTTTTGCAGGSEWDCVNDQTGNPSTGYPKSRWDTSYVRDNNGSLNREMFALADGLIPAGSVVLSIEINAWVAVNATTAALSYKRVGIDAGYVDAANTAVTAAICCTQRLKATWSCLNWTPADIDALEIGIRHAGAGTLSLSSIYVLVNYVPPGGTNYRSIGTLAGNVYSTGDATVAACSSVVSFGGGASLPSNVGQGDKLVIGASTYYVYARDSATQVTLQAPTATAHTAAAYSIQRAYNTLQAWEDDRDGNLVGEGRSEVGVCYDDGAFTGALTISGSTTDSTHFMKLTVAEGERHSGVKNTGVRIDAQGGWGGTDAITVEDEYTQVEWLEIKGIQDAGDGILFSASPAADDGLVANVFVHSCAQNGNAAFKVGAQDVTVRNCFATSGTTYGVRVLAGATAAIESCTLVGTTGSGSGVEDGVGATTSVKNTISVSHPSGNDFVLSGAISYFGYNMYGGVTGFDPASYQGGNQSPPGNLESLLVSLAAEDFHLEASGHTAGGTGVEQFSSFVEDIDGQTRLSPWDIGADDDQATAPTGTTTPRITVWREVAPY